MYCCSSREFHLHFFSFSDFLVGGFFRDCLSSLQPRQSSQLLFFPSEFKTNRISQTSYAYVKSYEKVMTASQLACQPARMFTRQLYEITIYYNHGLKGCTQKYLKIRKFDRFFSARMCIYILSYFLTHQFVFPFK